MGWTDFWASAREAADAHQKLRDAHRRAEERQHPDRAPLAPLRAQEDRIARLTGLPSAFASQH